MMDDRMQRAPAFVFASAREARAFGAGCTEHVEEIRRAAESTTTSSGRLRRDRAVHGEPDHVHPL